MRVGGRVAPPLAGARKEGRDRPRAVGLGAPRGGKGHLLPWLVVPWRDASVVLRRTPHLIDAGVDASVGIVGDALDNALMESQIGLYKTELIKPRKP